MDLIWGPEAEIAQSSLAKSSDLDSEHLPEIFEQNECN